MLWISANAFLAQVDIGYSPQKMETVPEDVQDAGSFHFTHCHLKLLHSVALVVQHKPHGLLSSICSVAQCSEHNTLGYMFVM